jgi:dTDP-4-dehydrorhamnose reductase
MKVLVIGHLGQVGWEVHRCLHLASDVVGVDRAEIDLADPKAVGTLVREISPSLIVNCAAYTAVDRAETEAALAQAINADSVAAIGAAAKAIDAGVIHFSTDYVFPGDASRPYKEDDPVGPLSVYGKTKLAGELALESSGCRYWTFRTSWVYSSRGRNFVHAIIQRAKEHGSLRVVDDQHGAPTWARSLAMAVATLTLSRLQGGDNLRQLMDETKGLYHLTADGVTTWYGFAAFMMGRLQPSLGRPISVLPIKTREFQTAAIRPASSALSNERFANAFSFRLPHWEIGASLCAAEFSECLRAPTGPH